MAQYISKDALVAEIDRRIKVLQKHPYENHKMIYHLDSLKQSINTLDVKKVDLENYNKVKKVLSLSFMHFLDANRQEGKMCLSNGECFDIEKAFDELDFSKLFRYMEKYLKAQKGE